MGGGVVLIAQDEETRPTIEEPTEPGEPSTQPIQDYDNTRPERTELDPTRMLFKTMGSLIMVIGIILILAWASRKFLPSRLVGGNTDGNQLRLIQSLSMGPRRFVSLIEADGKRYLIGVTEQQINLLKAIDELPFDGALSDIQAPKTVKELMEEEA